MRKNAIVTGSTGFIGSHLISRLISDNWNVNIIIRPTSNFLKLKHIKNKVAAFKHDGTTDNLIKIIESVKPDIVFHVSSLFLATHKPSDIVPLFTSNMLFSTQLVEAMVTNGIYRLINTGTSWQHFNNKKYNPVCLYAATKQAFNDMLTYYVETSQLKIITLELFDTYGPNDTRPKLFALLRKCAKENRSLAMSPGKQLIDLVYIEDVVDAYMIAAKKLLDDKVQKHEIYAISSKKRLSLKKIVKIYEQEIGVKLPIEWGAKPYREREVMVPWSRGKCLPGWKQKIDIRSGIKKLVSGYRY